MQEEVFDNLTAMADKKTVSILFPVHNEEKNLPIIHGQVRELWQELGEKYKYEIVFVDDGSSDGSWEVIEKLGRIDKSVHGVRFSRNFGHQAAIEAGLKTVKGAAVVMLDADGQHPVKFIKNLLKEWENGYMIVNTIRKDSDDVSWLRRKIPQMLYSLINRLSEMKLVPGAADFRLIDRKVVDVLNLLPERGKFYRGLVNWVGFKRTYVHFTANKRKYGRSSYTFKKLYKLAADGLTSFSDFPLKVAKLFGLFIFALAIVGIIVMLVLALAGLAVFPLWLYLFAIIVLLMGVQFIVTWFVGSYIARIFSQEQGRPTYIISEKI